MNVKERGVKCMSSRLVFGLCNWRVSSSEMEKSSGRIVVWNKAS